MEHHFDFLGNIVTLLFMAVVIVAVFKRLKLSPVLGYFVAGAIISKMGYMTPEDVGFLAEFGIVFLLFAIGIELTLERLIAMRKHVFGFGGLQVLITAALITVILHHVVGQTIEVSIVIGGALALSSTAVVLGVIQEQGIQSTQVGRISLAALLLQDLAVVPLLVLVPLLANEHDDIATALTIAGGRAMLAMVIIFIAGRLILRPLFEIIGSTKSEELFFATTLFIVLSASLATHMMGLSLALGAFIAGLLVAETQYHVQVEESMRPFKGLFMGLFFMYVGMTIDTDAIMAHASIIFLVSVLLLFGKAIIIIGLCRAFGFKLSCSLQTGLLLAQGGEFAFILFGLANQQLLIDDATLQILLLVVTLTMALTPLLAFVGRWIADRYEEGSNSASANEAAHETMDLDRHIIVCGFGRVGRMVSRMLTHRSLHYIAIDMNSTRASEGRAESFPVYRGDASRIDTLRHMGIDRAVAVIITIDNQVTNERIIRAIHEAYPKLPIITRIRDFKLKEKLVNAGATIVVPETYEVGLQLSGALLRAVGVSDYEISRLKNQFRDGDYAKAFEIEAIDQLELPLSGDGTAGSAEEKT